MFNKKAKKCLKTSNYSSKTKNTFLVHKKLFKDKKMFSEFNSSEMNQFRVSSKDTRTFIFTFIPKEKVLLSHMYNRPFTTLNNVHECYFSAFIVDCEQLFDDFGSKVLPKDLKSWRKMDQSLCKVLAKTCKVFF